MKTFLAFVLVCCAATLATQHTSALSLELRSPSIFFPKGYDTNRAGQILSVLQNPDFKYLGGLTSYWEPEFGTTLVYGGDTQALKRCLTALRKVDGLEVRITLSKDLSKETGSALQAGTWWVKYSHTARDCITVRINLAAKELKLDELPPALWKRGNEE